MEATETVILYILINCIQESQIVIVLFAAGRRVICKHMIALYFTAEPTVVDEFLKKVEEWEKEEEEEERQHFEELREYVNSLSKVELQEQLYNALVELEDRRNGYW